MTDEQRQWEQSRRDWWEEMYKHYRYTRPEMELDLCATTADLDILKWEARFPRPSDPPVVKESLTTEPTVKESLTVDPVLVQAEKCPNGWSTCWHTNPHVHGFRDHYGKFDTCELHGCKPIAPKPESTAQPVRRFLVEVADLPVNQRLSGVEMYSWVKPRAANPVRYRCNLAGPPRELPPMPTLEELQAIYFAGIRDGDVAGSWRATKRGLAAVLHACGLEPKE